MQEKYDQQKIINENNLSQIKKDRIIRNVLIALIILSFIIAIRKNSLFHYENT